MTPSSSSPTTILYADDEPDLREIVAMSLGMIPGATIHTCESGEQALQAIPTLKPDLILLDVMMPAMDGPSTLKNIRARPEAAHIPIIFMTAKAMPQEVARFKQMGAIEVIAKPFDPMRLAAQVSAIWNSSRQAPAAASAGPRVTGIGARFLERTRGELKDLRELMTKASTTADASALDGIRHLAHKMHGSGATFGFEEISEAAGELEGALHEGPRPAEAEQDFLKRCEGLVDKLDRAVQASRSE